MFKSLRIAIVGAALAFAAVAGIAAIPSPALAMGSDGNPYIPSPIEAIDPSTIVHVGDAKYCSIHPALYSCEGLDLTGGEVKGFAAREGKHHVAPTPKPTKDDCDPKGPPAGGGEQAGGDGDGNGRGPGGRNPSGGGWGNGDGNGRGPGGPHMRS